MQTDRLCRSSCWTKESLHCKWSIGRRFPKGLQGYYSQRNFWRGVEGRLWGRLGDVVASRTIGDTREIFTELSSFYKTTFWVSSGATKLIVHVRLEALILCLSRILCRSPIFIFLLQKYFPPVSLKVYKIYLLFISPPMVCPPYRRDEVWVLLRPWELCRR
jgi:hypothetical protein